MYVTYVNVKILGWYTRTRGRMNHIDKLRRRSDVINDGLRRSNNAGGGEVRIKKDETCRLKKTVRLLIKLIFLSYKIDNIFYQKSLTTAIIGVLLWSISCPFTQIIKCTLCG